MRFLLGEEETETQTRCSRVYSKKPKGELSQGVLRLEKGWFLLLLFSC